MKKFIAGSIFLLVIGTLGFLYRNAVEQPKQSAAQGSVVGKACTADAKICPDGTVVSRGGPDCSFAVCPLPNIEIDLASTTLSFVLPPGYVKSAPATSDENSDVVGTYTQTNVDTSDASTITITHYQIPAGESGSSAMLADTTFSPSGMTATSTDEFTTTQIGRNVWTSVVIERASNEVQSAYYVQNGNDLYRFDIDERGVQNATDSGLDIQTLPQHEALTQMLATLQISS